jgi:hypothetical protein
MGFFVASSALKRRRGDKRGNPPIKGAEKKKPPTCVGGKVRERREAFLEETVSNRLIRRFQQIFKLCCGAV